MEPLPANRKLLLVALLQSFFLIILHQSVDFEFWPGQSPHWLFAAYSLVIFLPSTLIFSSFTQLKGSFYIQLGVYALIFTLCGFYLGSQLLPERAPLPSQAWPYPLIVFLASVLLVPWITQNSRANWLPGYDMLSASLGRFLLVFAAAQLFTLSVLMLLMLWASLFEVIEIGFFTDLFSEPWFFYPAITLSQAIGVIQARSRSNFANQLFAICRNFAILLLPVLVTVAMLFFVAVFFSELDTLWRNGGSSLIFVLVGAIVLCLNLSGDALTQRLWYRHFIATGLLLLPCYLALSGWGLYLRIDQYGLSLARLWAILIAGVSMIVCMGYVWQLFVHKACWYRRLSTVNRPVTLCLLGLLIATQTPLLDFRGLSVNSQINRLNAGITQPADFDPRYLLNELGRKGLTALESLQYKVTDEQLKRRIQTALALETQPLTTQTLLDLIDMPEQDKQSLPQDLVTALETFARHNTHLFDHASALMLRAIALDNTPEPEYLFIARTQRRVELRVFYLGTVNGVQGWQTGYLDQKVYGEQSDDLLDAIKSGNFDIVEPRFKDIQIGEHRYELHSPF
ncbi:hypothetical protein CWB99_21690 [Pseudoalteromonas rubra]|uniref:DUF4153 domain-containing protein n=1 Tax=Pseudoalteromonas rubra TaxID=43658 RepID=A0A5S3WGW2_9GAMM|nr:DUF4153 domain-containing protein [Pseudoalteromonas rubra]TMP24628.1 hypothetical protein CWB99_21690 [Pseudoalteromonas rubra]TMP36299.1 hypothetical protein CWC00_02335 [Pseudoalteromonas rubra]